MQYAYLYLSGDDLSLCQTAFNQACKEAGPITESIRLDIAARILTSARLGERNLTNLKQAAMGWMLSAA